MKNNETVTVTVGNMADMQSRQSTGNSAPADSTNQVIQPIPEIPVISGNPTQNPKNSDSGLPTSVAKVEENGDPVNMATGEYIYEDKDFIIPDMDGDYSLIRRYTGPAGRTTHHSLGKVWTLSTDTNVKSEGNSAVVTMPDGKTVEFIIDNNSYTNKKGGTKKYTLEKNKNGYTFTDNPKKQKYYYDQSGQIIKKTDRNGNSTEYRYNENGLDRLILPTGYTLTFRWENSKIAEIADNAGRTVKYKYEKGLLKKVIRCDGTEIKYTYNEKENLKTITDASGCTYLQNEYDDRIPYTPYNKLKTYTDGEGNKTTYNYDECWRLAEIIKPTHEKGETYRYDSMDRPVSHTDECGRVTIYRRNAYGDIIQIIKCGIEEDTQNHCNAAESITYEYDTCHRIIKKQTGKYGHETYNYDKCGRITGKTQNSYNNEKEQPDSGYIYKRDGILSRKSTN